MNILNKLIPLFVVLAIIGLGSAGYFYFQYQKAQKEIQTIKTDPSTVQKAAQEEAKRLVADVGKLIELPGGEDPTVATITDISKLKDQPFFQRAKNGDKVLIYTNAKKAILYDPRAHKVIDVAPVNIGTSSAQQAQQAKIALRNGTLNQDATKIFEAEIKKAYTDANIVAKDSAIKSDYEKSLVIPLNDGAKGAAENLASTLHITQADAVPSGENKPNADILILIGKDKVPAPPLENKPQAPIATPTPVLTP